MMYLEPHKNELSYKLTDEENAKFLNIFPKHKSEYTTTLATLIGLATGLIITGTLLYMDSNNHSANLEREVSKPVVSIISDYDNQEYFL